MSNPLCPVQRLFASCIKSWLKTLKTPTPDVSRNPDWVRELVNKALAEQEQISWYLTNLSRYWLEYCYLIEPKIDEGE
jgi:hypothetical protein